MRSDLFGVPRFGGLRVTDLHFLAESDAEKAGLYKLENMFHTGNSRISWWFLHGFPHLLGPMSLWPVNQLFSVKRMAKDPLHGSIYTKPILVWLFSD